jgi:hypothetical protein
VHDILEPETELKDKAKAAFGAGKFYAKWLPQLVVGDGQKPGSFEGFLGRIVDLGSELYAMASAVVYAKTIEQEHPERAEPARELADLFCRQSRRRVDRLFTELWANDDDLNYEGGLKVLDGRYKWIEEGIVDPSGDGHGRSGQTCSGR